MLEQIAMVDLYWLVGGGVLTLCIFAMLWLWVREESGRLDLGRRQALSTGQMEKPDDHASRNDSTGWE